MNNEFIDTLSRNKMKILNMQYELIIKGFMFANSKTNVENVNLNQTKNCVRYTFKQT